MAEYDTRQVLFTSHLAGGKTLELVELANGRIAIRWRDEIPFCSYAAAAMDKAVSAFKSLADGAPIKEHPKE